MDDRLLLEGGDVTGPGIIADIIQDLGADIGIIPDDSIKPNDRAAASLKTPSDNHKLTAR